MIKVLFICLGNICRSPMAEFVFRDMINKAGLDAHFQIASAATSREELGNPVHPGTRKKLREHGISCEGKRAVQLKKADYETYDYLIGMDSRNLTNIIQIVGKDSQNKVYRLLDFSDRPGDIADPWYTGDFDRTYGDVHRGCRAFLMSDKIQKAIHMQGE